MPWVPSVPIGTRSSRGTATDSSGWWHHLGLDAAATPEVHPGVIYLEAVSLCLLGGCRWEQILPWAGASQCAQPLDPHGERVQGTVQKPLLDRRVQLSAAQPQQSRAGAAARAPKPSTATNHSSSKGRHGGKASAQALPPRAASAKDLTGIRLELHQVSALSPQLQASMSFTLPGSLSQGGTLNTRRGITTRDQGQQQQRSPFLEPLPILPSPFPSWLLFTLERFSGAVICPQETFHTLHEAAAGRDLPDSQTASWVHYQSSVDASSLRLPFELLGTALPSLVQS